MPRERFERLFRGNEDWYGQYEANPKTGAKLKAYTKAGPIPDEAWDRHLAGDKTGLGIVPSSDAGTTNRDGPHFDAAFSPWPRTSNASTWMVLPSPMSSARQAPKPSSVKK